MNTRPAIRGTRKTLSTRLEVWAFETAHAFFTPPVESRCVPRLVDVRLLEGDAQSKRECQPLELDDLVDVECVMVGNFIMTRWTRRPPIVLPGYSVTVTLRNDGEVARIVLVELELEQCEVVDVAFEELAPSPGVGP
jgi:hypothetical protein